MALDKITAGDTKGIYWIGGSKGGVGKSMLAIAALDYLLSKGEKVLLVECDTSNPDVWKMYHQEVDDTELIKLDEADGWVDFVNVCQDNPRQIIVVNTAARNNDAVTQYGATLNSSIEELGRPVVALWVINRQRDSMELLRDFVEVIPRASLHVVRNGHFGEERKFELYNDSPIRRDLVEGRGGMSLLLPDLADRVADDLYVKRLSIAKGLKALPLGNRAELGRWRSETRKVLSQVLG